MTIGLEDEKGDSVTLDEVCAAPMGIAGVIQDRVPGTKELPVTLTGQMTGRRRWSGRAAAQEPIVGMSIVVAGPKCHWVKSGQREPELPIDVQLPAYDEGDRDVQVAAGVGGNFVYSRCVLVGREQPLCVEPHPGRTGGPILLAVVEGDPRIELHALFIALSDVKFGRNRLWHLRPELAANIEEPLRSVLTRGRTGELQRALTSP